MHTKSDECPAWFEEKCCCDQIPDKAQEYHDRLQETLRRLRKIAPQEAEKLEAEWREVEVSQQIRMLELYPVVCGDGHLRHFWEIPRTLAAAHDHRVAYDEMSPQCPGGPHRIIEMIPSGDYRRLLEAVRLAYELGLTGVTVHSDLHPAKGRVSMDRGRWDKVWRAANFAYQLYLRVIERPTIPEEIRKIDGTWMGHFDGQWKAIEWSTVDDDGHRSEQ